VPEGGFKVTLLDEVMDRIEGVTATVDLMPWKRCQLEVREGNLDGILPLFPSEERSAYLVFSSPTFDQASGFWYARDRHPSGIEWNGNSDSLANLRLGMLNGSIIDAEMERAFRSQGEILRAADVPALFLMLEYDRVDLIAIDMAVGRYHVERMAASGSFAAVDPPISSQASVFGLSRVTGADAYLDAFNAAIAALQAEGRIAAILEGDG
jgi:polar amino acid transport system substrate-binding protein